MIKNKYKFSWNSFFRCQYADRETVEMMRESGCDLVALGIESGSQKILDNMNKAVAIEQYYNGISLLNEYGITSTASFIIGFPGETYETFQETKKFIEEGKPTFFKAEAWICLPLSPINNNREKFNIQGVGRHWSHETMDSNTAHALVDELFFTVKNSIRLQYGDYIRHMKQRGLSMEQIKWFYSCYNDALKDKIRDTKNKGIRTEILEALKEICVKVK
jgi:wyosine [tRNA(Phe)-imidazoG37] synthetase (radical SAM superfamily)